MDDSKHHYKTIAEVDALRDPQRMEYLRQQWSLTSPVIEGKLEHRGNFWWLTNVTDPEGRPLEFPLSDLSGKHKALSHVGVFIGPDLKAGDGRRAQARFCLASTKERKKKVNPLLIRVTQGSVKILTRISAEYVYQRHDGSVDIEETLCRGYVEERRADLSEALGKIEAHVADHEERAVKLYADNVEASTELFAKQRQIKKLGEDIEREMAGWTRLLDEHQREREEGRQQIDAELEQRRQELEHRFAQRKQQCEHEIAGFEQKLGQLRSQHDREMEMMHNQADQLRAYVRSKAERLFALEFITQEQWDDLVPDQRQEPAGETRDWPRLDLGPEGARAEAVGHIQRYLYGRGMVYPRALLANFYALLRTGDLIILSGLSGSGKTRLVRSFAEATGNVAHVIPVKPNWTSAEDLTGYYNPLQRAYLTTPFLDAVIAARRDPGRLHIICLDEMNLARVEYYFADFLSSLEERGREPSLHLYSDEEAGHVLVEFRLFFETLMQVSPDRPLQRLGDFLQDGEVVTRLREQLGIDDGESIIQLHARLRRMVAGVLNVPSRLTIPANLRFVGAVNMDDTTHYLSPKVLDRAHVLRFGSPLSYWAQVEKEVEGGEIPETGIRIPASDFPRDEYPRFDPNTDDVAVRRLAEWSGEFLAPLGIEMGLRTLRQSILYRHQLGEVMAGDSVDRVALDNLVRQKLLPRFSFDGSQKPRGHAEADCVAVVEALQRKLAAEVPESAVFSAGRELADLIARAKANHNIFNYWA
jgi:energy-coupling factor transporter ATP-binding protein EcfA2